MFSYNKQVYCLAEKGKKFLLSSFLAIWRKSNERDNNWNDAQRIKQQWKKKNGKVFSFSPTFPLRVTKDIGYKFQQEWKAEGKGAQWTQIAKFVQSSNKITIRQNNDGC